MFVDASAIVAILAPEDDGPSIAARLESVRDPVTSSLAVFETVLALRRIRDLSVTELMLLLQTFLERAGIRLVGIGADQHIPALRAHDTYGKGSGHPAQLNMGDCIRHGKTPRDSVAVQRQ